MRKNTRNDIDPPVKYLTQRDNLNPFTGKKDGHNQCMVASFVMCINWLGDKLDNKHLKVYNEHTHLTCVGRNASELEKRRYMSINHAEAANNLLSALKLPHRFKYFQGDSESIKKMSITKKSPIIVGSLITSYGHIIVYIGNGKWHDPYGKCSEITGKYSGQGFDISGANVAYSDNFVNNNIFRNMKRTCWFIDHV